MEAARVCERNGAGGKHHGVRACGGALSLSCGHEEAVPGCPDLSDPGGAVRLCPACGGVRVFHGAGGDVLHADAVRVRTDLCDGARAAGVLRGGLAPRSGVRQVENRAAVCGCDADGGNGVCEQLHGLPPDEPRLSADKLCDRAGTAVF